MAKNLSFIPILRRVLAIIATAIRLRALLD